MSFESRSPHDAGLAIAAAARESRRNLVLVPINPILSPYALQIFATLGNLIRGYVGTMRPSSPLEADQGPEERKPVRQVWDHLQVDIVPMGRYSLVDAGEGGSLSALLSEHLKGLIGRGSDTSTAAPLRKIGHFVTYKSACFGTIANDILCSLLDSTGCHLVGPDIVRHIRCEDISRRHKRSAKGDSAKSSHEDAKTAEETAKLILEDARRESRTSDLILRFFGTSDDSGWSVLGRILALARAEARNGHSNVYVVCDRWLMESAMSARHEARTGDMPVHLVGSDFDPQHPEAFPLPLFTTPISGQIVREQLGAGGVSEDARLDFCDTMYEILVSLGSDRFDMKAMEFWHDDLMSRLLGRGASRQSIKDKRNELLGQIKAQKEALATAEELGRNGSLEEALLRRIADHRKQIANRETILEGIEGSLRSYERATLDCAINGLLRLDRRTIEELRYVL